MRKVPHPSIEPVEMVRRGYNVAARSYSAARGKFENLTSLEMFRTLVSPPATVLDVGCGSGKPIARYLVDHGYQVIGLDVSHRQIELAKSAVPEAEFEIANMLELSPGEYQVDAVVSFYAIFHTPREHHERLLKTLASFLLPRGVMLITMGASDYVGTEPDFHGVEMYWSHFGPEKNRELVEAAGLTVLSDEINEVGSERHQVLTARRAG